MKTTIYCIIGASGSGKSTIVNKIKHTFKIPEIISYTNRPMRKDETNGDTHCFIKGLPGKDAFIEGRYGGYDYWVRESQIKLCTSFDKVLYIIDEKSFGTFKDNIERFNLENRDSTNSEVCTEIRVVPIYIIRSSIDIDPSRANRDNDNKISFKYSNIGYIVHNNGTIDDTVNEILNIINTDDK